MPSFRPLYRGLFSIDVYLKPKAGWCQVFVPFIGDFFQSAEIAHLTVEKPHKFSSPLSGTFFNPL